MFQLAGAQKSMLAELRPASQKQTAHTTTPKKVLTTKDIQRHRIANIVHQYQPKKGWKYAYQVAAYYIDSARKVGVHPYALVAIGRVESEFTMSAGQQIGIMQFTRSEAREYQKKDHLNVHRLQDNIYAGAYQMARLIPKSRNHYAASRGGNLGRNSRSGYNGPNPLPRYQVAWRRYNGGGDPHYVRKVTKAYLHFMNMKS